MVSSDGIYSYTDVKTAEMTTKGLDYNINLVDKADLGQLTPIFERRSIVGQMLSNSTACYKETIHRSQSTQQTSLLPHFKKLPQAPQPSAATTLSISGHHSHLPLQSQWLYW